MNKNVVDLQDLKTLIKPEVLSETGADDESESGSLYKKPQLDSQGRAYATGKRKTSVARLWVSDGSGKMTINGKKGQDYFFQPHLNMMIAEPFRVLDSGSQFDVLCTVEGGGLSSQAGAVRHALSKALAFYRPDGRTALKRKGLLIRDSRVVERKKPGQPKARKRFQFSKR